MTPRQEWRSQCCDAPVTGMGINDTIVEPPGCTKCLDRCQPVMRDVKEKSMFGMPIITDPKMKQGEWRMENGQMTSNPPEPPWYYHPKFWDNGEACRNEEDTPKLAEIVAEAMKRGIAQAGEIVLPRIGKFIDKVESGRAKSKETYADMLDIVEWFDEKMR